jgi:hypothetical protein
MALLPFRFKNIPSHQQREGPDVKPADIAAFCRLLPVLEA